MQIITIHNVLQPELVETETEHETLIDYLQEVYPTGFASPTKIFDGGRQLTVDEFDLPFKDFKYECAIMHAPGVAAITFASLGTFWSYVAAAAVNIAISYVAGQIFKPDMPEGYNDPANDSSDISSDSYKLNSQQNRAKLGQVIPVVYGKCRVYPPLLEATYTRYNGTTPHQTIYQLLCIGAGWVDVDDVMIADSLVTDVAAGNFIYRHLNAAHIGGNLEDYIRTTLDPKYKQRSRRLDELSDLKLVMDFSNVYSEERSSDGFAGPFNLNNKLYGQIAAVQGIEVTLSCPAGIYKGDDAGTMHPHNVGALVRVRAYDEDDNRLGSWDTIHVMSGSDRSPLHKTFEPNYTQFEHGTRYTVEIKRNPGHPIEDDVKVSEDIYLSEIRYNEIAPNISRWGNLTMIWCKVGATAGLTTGSAFKINCWVRNGLSKIDVVMKDIYSDNEYGAGQPRSDLNLIAPTDEEFNAVLDQPVTVIDMLTIMGKAGGYQAFIRGPKIMLRKDEAQPIRTVLYNETNIIKGSFTVDYNFGEISQYDGVRIKYRDKDTFKQIETTYPTQCINPEEMELVGVTSDLIASKAAKYGWLNILNRRKTIVFDTDDQGRIPSYMDRIGIAHESMFWGESGQIAYITRYEHFIEITLDRDYNLSRIGLSPLDCEDLMFDPYYTECPETTTCYDIPEVAVQEELCKTNTYDSIVFRGPEGQVSDVYPFTIESPRRIRMIDGYPDWLYVGSEYDRTHFTLGQTNNFVEDYLLIKAEPSDTSIRMTAINYSEEVYS